jgi:hypothetical protein
LSLAAKTLPGITPGWRTALFITLLYLLFFPIYWGLYAWNPDWHFRWFQGEDKVVEWITFGGFLAAGILALQFTKFWTIMPLWTRVFFIGLGLFFVICAGEEISWGQRVLGFATPDSLIEINTQNEFNVHNIEFEHFHPKDVVSWALKLWGLFIPLGLLLFRRRWGEFRCILSPAAMIPCYAIPELMNLAEESLARFYGSRYGEAAAEMVHTQLEEWMEMYWGIGVLLSVLALRDLWRSRLSLDSEQSRQQTEEENSEQPA